MDFNDQTHQQSGEGTQQPQQTNEAANHLNDIAAVGENMVGWLKFLGIMSIIGGVLTAITIVGIIIAWLPIWMGVLLFQAGNQITEARVSRNHYHLVEMMRKFKTYFMIQGILLLISLVFVVISFLISGAAMLQMLGGGDYTY